MDLTTDWLYDVSQLNRCKSAFWLQSNIAIVKPLLIFSVISLFFPVFSDASSPCLLVWTGICCQTVVRTWGKCQCSRQGELDKKVNYCIRNNVNYCLQRLEITTKH